MSQTTLGDDELFGEAAEEMRADVEEHLEQARAELPAAADVWETEADNVLGVLNGLRSALDAGDAEEHLRQAKKWYTMGERADAFEDAADLAAAIEDLESLIDAIGEAHDDVSDLTNAIPELRGSLQEFEDEE
jgi:phage-related minor tail protein